MDATGPASIGWVLFVVALALAGPTRRPIAPEQGRPRRERTPVPLG